MANLRDLKYKRARIKGQLTRIQNFFKSEGQRTATEARVRQAKLEECWKNFEEVQSEIDLRPTENDEEYERQVQEGNAERQVFEMIYYKVAEKINRILNGSQEQNRQIEGRENNGNQRNYEAPRNKPKLPEIKLPEFNGNYTKLFFKNSFETTIHEEEELTPIQKHQYLVGVLRREAFKVIQGYQISNENYAEAWKLLKDTYDNTMIIIETHLDELLQFPMITKEDKAESLRLFVWHIRTHISALKSLEQPVDRWETMIIHLAKKKLNFVEQRDWQNMMNNRTPRNMPTIDEFLKFLMDRYNTMRVLNQGKAKKEATAKTTTLKKSDKKISLSITSYECPIYTEPQADTGKQENSGSTSTTIVNYCKKQEKINSLCNGKKTELSVILSTARVKAYDVKGNSQSCRVLLDPGSQTNIITESFLKRLGLPNRKENQAISGINQTRSNANNVTEIRIESIYKGFSTNIECLVLPSITERLPQSKINITQLNMPKDIDMADPRFDEPGPIDMLIGAGLYWKILVGTPRNKIEGQPSLQNTRLGWIIGGEIPGVQPKTSQVVLTNEVLSQQLERFWRQEELPETPEYTDEEKYCEQYFLDTVKRDKKGQFIVRLPIRKQIQLGDSKEQALRRLHLLERRFEKNPKLKEEYHKFMEDYIEQNHMSKIYKEELNLESYFLPHQAVIRADNITTKLRVVFDASAKTTLGTSLNDKLIPGPNLQKELFDIILRFRTYEYVVTADVTMMYRQIMVNPLDRALQRILWRKNPKEPVTLFELNTVTYGTACAPYLAIRCLRKLAEEERDLSKAAKEDVLQYEVKIKPITTTTKRNVLSNVAQVFDPLGLLAPLLMNGKIIMRQLWTLKIDWDEPLPPDKDEAWQFYYNSLSKLNELRIPRNAVSHNRSNQFDIFGFGDTSEKAYGACLYAVAPLKTISVPRLELEAALLLAKLYNVVKKAYGERVRQENLWSDSTIVLGWIETPPNLLKTFVANRISKIQHLTPKNAWQHVTSRDNPADMLSQGMTIEQLIDKSMVAWTTLELIMLDPCKSEKVVGEGESMCPKIFSDNATNFIGAARELQEIYEFLKKNHNEITTQLANQHIQWNFIPPRAPNFGGLWEAAVKVAKRHLYIMTRDLTLTFEECYTLLTEIEAIMNSRPLTALSSDPNDLSVLTPSHFLIGDSLVQPVQHNLTETPDNRLTRWQHFKKIRQNFWRRWHSEYLHELQEKKKWTVSGKNIALGTIVMLKEDNLPPLQWAIGRVIELHPGPDGITRVVSVRTQGGVFKRAVRNLCPIPMDDCEED
ncbi:uncharacterized protein [Linepithema humile]|uniref:uncharacterized protein n=1 Tax=Linepithema humile TaxID=83485 RepID=UPI00351DDE52